MSSDFKNIVLFWAANKFLFTVLLILFSCKELPILEIERDLSVFL